MINIDRERLLASNEFQFLKLFPLDSQAEIERSITLLLYLDTILNLRIRGKELVRARRQRTQSPIVSSPAGEDEVHLFLPSQAETPEIELKISEFVSKLTRDLAKKIPLLPDGEMPAEAPTIIQLSDDTHQSKKQFLLSNLYLSWSARHYSPDTSETSIEKKGQPARLESETRPENWWRKKLRNELQKLGRLSPPLETVLLDLNSRRPIMKNLVRIIMVGAGTFAAANFQTDGKAQRAISSFLDQDFREAGQIFLDQGFREGIKHEVFEAKRSVIEAYGNSTGIFYSRFFSMTEQCLANPTCDIFEEWNSGRIISPQEVYMALQFPEQSEAIIADVFKRINTFGAIPNAINIAISEVTDRRHNDSFSNEYMERYYLKQAREQAFLEANGHEVYRKPYNYTITPAEIRSVVTNSAFDNFSISPSDQDIDTFSNALMDEELVNHHEFSSYLRVEQNSLYFSISDFYSFLAAKYPGLTIGSIPIDQLAALLSDSPEIGLPASAVDRISILEDLFRNITLISRSNELFSPEQTKDLNLAYLNAVSRGNSTYSYTFSRLVSLELSDDATTRVLLTPSREEEFFLLYTKIDSIRTKLKLEGEILTSNLFLWISNDYILNPEFSDTSSVQSFIESDALSLNVSVDTYIERQLSLSNITARRGLRQMNPAKILTFMHRWLLSGNFPAEGEEIQTETIPWSTAYSVYQPDQTALQLKTLFDELGLNQDPRVLNESVFSDQIPTTVADELRLTQLVLGSQFISTDQQIDASFFEPHGLANQVREFIREQSPATQIFLTNYWVAKGSEFSRNSYRTQSVSLDLLAELHLVAQRSAFFADRSQRERKLLAESMAIISLFSEADLYGITLTEPIILEIASQVVAKAQEMYLTHEELMDLTFFVFESVRESITSPRQYVLQSGAFKEVGGDSPLAMAEMDLTSINFRRVGATAKPEPQQFMLPAYYSGTNDHSLAISIQPDGSTQVEGDEVSTLTKEVFLTRYPRMHYLSISQSGEVTFATTEEISAQMESIHATSLLEWFTTQNLRIFMRVAPVPRNEKSEIVSNSTLEFGQTWGRFFVFIATTDHQEFGTPVNSKNTKLVYLEAGRPLDTSILTKIALEMGVPIESVLVLSPDVDVPAAFNELALGGYPQNNRVDPTIPNNAKNEYPAWLIPLK